VETSSTLPSRDLLRDAFTVCGVEAVWLACDLAFSLRLGGGRYAILYRSYSSAEQLASKAASTKRTGKWTVDTRRTPARLYAGWLPACLAGKPRYFSRKAPKKPARVNATATAHHRTTFSNPPRRSRPDEELSVLVLSISDLGLVSLISLSAAVD
jgi:hypothetical protein